MNAAREWVDLFISDIQGDLSEYLPKNDESRIYVDGDLFGEIVYGINSAYKKDLTTNNIQIELVQHYGGEGEGDQYYDVYKITDTLTHKFAYIKYEGYYDSWNGTSWDAECRLVTPVEKTIIVYENVS